MRNFESLSSGNFFNDEKENSNKKNGSSLDEIWKKMNGNLNEIVENNVENLDEVTEQAYNIAKERNLINIGKKYKEYYEYILNKKNK